ncbi:hypothetical protein WM40_05485 [Robbsia andropogonis]|uniref:Uncharacterized protein n=1 Tax=Robbsia andropogonis TaxID=28092 RepID=A0A0F5K2Q9_9BURK|nr:hypothetical protein WM40_05485 [Robbsia andropogonis]
MGALTARHGRLVCTFHVDLVITEVAAPNPASFMPGQTPSISTEERPKDGRSTPAVMCIGTTFPLEFSRKNARRNDSTRESVLRNQLLDRLFAKVSIVYDTMHGG